MNPKYYVCKTMQITNESTFFKNTYADKKQRISDIWSLEYIYMRGEPDYCLQDSDISEVGVPGFPAVSPERL